MIQLLYLILVALAMGLALWRLLGIDEDDGLSSLFLCFCTGLALFVLFSAALGFLNLVNWMAYLAIALVMLALVHMKGKLSVSMPKIDRGWIIVLILFALHLALYLYGSFAYPWLEDDDPWVHASAVRYVSIYGTYIQPEHLPLHYLAPYPPFFDVLLGVLFQVDGSSLQFTLKFFNALLVSLSIPLFYVWARKKLDGASALWATGILAALPSFMSHFIWAQTLAMLLAFPAFYFIERYLNEKDGSKKSLGILAVFLLASVMISQPSVAGIIFIMSCIYVFASALPKAMEKKLDLGEVLRHGTVLAGALALALLLFWGPMFLLYGQEKVLGQMGLSSSFVTEKNDDTSGGVVYGISDFLDAPPSSKMDQPIGLGLFVSLLCLIGLASSALKLKAGENTSLHLLLILWLIFCLIGVEGNAMPIKMMPHRFWVFLALPVAMLAGSGAVLAQDYAQKHGAFIYWLVMLVVLVGVYSTSVVPKYAVETSMWPPGVSWTSNEQVAGYVRLGALPANTKVFSFCGNEDLVNGMNLFGYSWVKEVRDYKSRSIKDSSKANYEFLKRYGYQYAVIDTTCLKTSTEDEIAAKLNALSMDSRFQPMEALSGKAFYVFRIS